MRDLTVVLVGAASVSASELEKALDLPPWFFGLNKIGTKEFYQTVGFSDTGFKFQYKDSFFCMDELTDYVCISNQLYHSIPGFALAHLYSYTSSALATIYHDFFASPLGMNGGSQQDRNLGFKMGNAGEQLKVGLIKRSGLGAWLLKNIADTNYQKIGISQAEIKRLAPFKKKFRVFEYEQNGDTPRRWALKGDMVEYSCMNGNKIYYQDYDYFYFGGVIKNPARAVLNDDPQNKKVVFLHGNLFNSYLNPENICKNLQNLMANNSYQLHLEFNNLKKNQPADITKYMIDRLKQNLKDKPIF